MEKESNKEAYYFSHDSNARTDEKIVALLMKHKWEGYGLYWALIEKLRESTCYKLSTNFNVLAYDLRTNNELIKSIVTGFGLFTIDESEGKFWSNRLLRSMKKKSERAKKAAEIRWNDANAMQVHTKCNASAMQNDAIKVKESKLKKSKVNDIAPTWKTFPNKESLSLEIPEVKSGAVIQQAKFTGKGDWTIQQVIGLWDVFKVQNFTGEKYYRTENDVYSHFINWCKNQTVTTASKNSVSGLSEKDEKAIFG